MSTRSAIARRRPTGGGWDGIYVHSDGAPTTRLPVLAAGHRHFGGDVDKLATYLIDEHPSGWSSIGDRFDLPTGNIDVSNMPTTDDGRIDWTADILQQNQCFCHGHQPDPEPARVTSDDLPAGLQWLYILQRSGVAVYRAAHRRWVKVTTVSWTDLHRHADTLTAAKAAGEPTPAIAEFQAIECGEQLERCSHYAWVHFDVPQESRDLGVDEWLGNDPVPLRDAIAIVTPAGDRYTMTRNGSARGRMWWTSVIDANGQRTDIPTHRIVRDPDTDGFAPITGMTYVLPPTATHPDGQTITPEPSNAAA